MNTWGHRIYICVLSLLALGVLALLYRFFGSELKIGDILFWGSLAVVAETFYIILPNDAATSVGMAVYLAAIVTTNPLVATLLPVIAFIFRMPEDQGKRHHLLTYHYTIILYNISAHVIFVGTISCIYYIFNGYGLSSIAEIIPIALILLTISELISIILIAFYFYTREEKRIPLIKSILGALPSTWAVGALGLILAFVEGYGKPVVVLVFIPLLLARYSFKLYFDSQKTGQETIEALNAALHYRDAYTASHTRRVEVLTFMLAKSMNYNTKDLERIKMAARLHDIGKIGVPDRILNKPGKLTKEEYERIKDHSAMGSQILSNVDTFKKVTTIVRQHHERPDGKGYPDGLKGEAISLDASILSIADTYDAMTSKRPYRDGMTKEYAISELRKYSGTQFRSDLVEVFIAALDNLDEAELVFDMPKTYLEDALKDEIEVINQSDEVVYDS